MCINSLRYLSSKKKLRSSATYGVLCYEVVRGAASTRVNQRCGVREWPLITVFTRSHVHLLQRSAVIKTGRSNQIIPRI